MTAIKYLAAGAVSFALGYLACHSLQDERYTIRRLQNKPYLVDKITKNSAVINENLQTGTIEQRVISLIQENDLKSNIESIEKNLRGVH